jgi:hypothetical protein
LSLLKDTLVTSLIFAPTLTLRAPDLDSEYFMPVERYVLEGVV